MNYKEKRELEMMEITIHEAEATVAQIEARLADPTLYERAHTEAKSLINDLAAAKTRVELLYTRWSELEAMK